MGIVPPQGILNLPAAAIGTQSAIASASTAPSFLSSLASPATALFGFSTVMGVIGRRRAAAARYEAMMANYYATRREAKDVVASGLYQQARLAEQGIDTMAHIEAQFAAAGQGLDSSTMTMLKKAARNIEYDRLIASEQTDKMYRSKMEQSNYLFSSAQNQRKIKNSLLGLGVF
jgi:hypothetical protein